MKKIIYQGAPGSFSHLIGDTFFSKDSLLVGRVSKFKKICEEFLSEQFDYLVLPIENTVAGSVYENYDNLFNFELHVIAEKSIRIEHHLLTKANDVKKISKVYSHPKALEQCELFFENHPWIEEVAVHDTAGAAEFVSQSGDSTHAAIASKEASKLYDLPVLLSNIEDDHRNFTRFFIISKKPEFVPLADKASLVFSTSHKPGSLFHALKTFSDHRLNLTKLESRPLPDNPFEYFFYVDFEFDPAHRDAVDSTLKDLRNEVHFLKILGIYKKDTNGRMEEYTSPK